VYASIATGIAIARFDHVGHDLELVRFERAAGLGQVLDFLLVGKIARGQHAAVQERPYEAFRHAAGSKLRDVASVLLHLLEKRREL
jgi:hypothetical protein